MKFEPTPAVLNNTEDRADRIYVMLDNCKARIQEGKRGRGAKKRKRHKGFEEKFNIDVTGKRRPGYEKQESKGKKAKKNAKKDKEEDWRDVRAVLIYREKDLAECSKGRRSLLRRRIGANMGTKEEFCKLMHLWFHEEGVYSAEEVVVVADGGAGIWEMIDEILPNTAARRVIQISDWCHAVTHLWRVANKHWVGKSKKANVQRQRWIDGLVKYLAEGKVSNVLQRLKRLQKGSRGELYDEMRRCIEYFEKHRGRKRYGYFRKRRLTIGSGAIESVHNWVVQARYKQAGMAWSQRRLNAMLRLRCAWASERWDDIFAGELGEPPEKLNDFKKAA